jgi:hypothetical protein
MKAKLLASLAALALLVGCIPSVYPLFNDKDVISDPSIVGTWAKEDKETWVFSEDPDAKDKSYKLEIKEDGKTGQFRARLGKLDGKLYLDLVLDELENKDKFNGWETASLIPGHLILRVWQVKPELTLSMPKFKDVLKEHPNELDHYSHDDGLVLTAKTSDLQAFMIKHANDPDLYSDNDKFEMHRGGTEKKP